VESLVKLKGFQKLTLTDEALRIWLKAVEIKKPNDENIFLQESLRRILAEELVAQDDLPMYDKSAVDGYAVKSFDLAGATQFKPSILRLIQTENISSKQAKQIWTGSPIPTGSDTVVMLENTKVLESGEIEVWRQLAPGDNISKKGEDIKKGEIAVRVDTRLNPYHIALAAALGKSDLKVYKKPKIAILATGNELAEIGTKPIGKQIFDSNKVMLHAMCHEFGVETVDYGIAKDNIDEISQKIKKALKSCDAVITSGGTSVGGLDLVPDAVNKLGKPGVVIHGVALRPAMPTALAVLEGKPIIILSGNPIAAVIGFEVFGRPLICKLLGMRKTESRPVISAILGRNVVSALGRKTYVRVCVKKDKEKMIALPISTKGSGAITTMIKSNGFVVIPENREGIVEGETVTVHMFSPIDEEYENV
jgi:molybdopterin molybdotransferase